MKNKLATFILAVFLATAVVPTFSPENSNSITNHVITPQGVDWPISPY